MRRNFCLGVLFLALTLVQNSHSQEHKTGEKEEPINRSQWLSDSFFLAWTADFHSEKITFSVTAKTRGYVGFGLSYNGNMKGADIVVGGVKEDGTPYFSDRYAESLTIPVEDKKQDWHLISAAENETHTMLSFYRPFKTCDDEQDIIISHDTLSMIWSLGEGDDLKYHVYRGGSQVNLLDPPILPTENLKSWSFEVPSNVPTEKDTYYWCTVHRAPRFTNKTHIIGFEVILDGDHALEHTHHMILRKCLAPRGQEVNLEKELEPWVGHAGGDCYQRQLLHIKGLCTANIYVWTNGGSRLMLPEHVGYPVAEKPQDEYYVLEVHYDNPNLKKNVSYNTGARVFYTETPRTYDAGLLYVGHEVDASITIPPNKKNWEVVGHCSSECTQQKFPKDGIHFFNVLLHAHLASRSLKLRHFRDGAELPWIAVDQNFNFNFQQSRQLRKEVNVKPGDHLTVECFYDTTWKKPLAAVTGGLSSYSEMCEAWVFYWPRIPDLDICTSIHSQFKRLLQKAGITNVTTEKDQYHPMVLAPENLKGLLYEQVLSNHVDWTDDFSNDFQDDLVKSDHATLCVGHADYATPVAGQFDDDMSWPRTNYPKIKSEYQPPAHSCNVPAPVAPAEVEQEIVTEETVTENDEALADATAEAEAEPGVSTQKSIIFDDYDK